MPVIQFVKFSSPLTDEEARSVMERRAPEFRQVPGLLQKYTDAKSARGMSAGSTYLIPRTRSGPSARRNSPARSRARIR